MHSYHLSIAGSMRRKVFFLTMGLIGRTKKDSSGLSGEASGVDARNAAAAAAAAFDDHAANGAAEEPKSNGKLGTRIRTLRKKKHSSGSSGGSVSQTSASSAVDATASSAAAAAAAALEVDAAAHASHAPTPHAAAASHAPADDADFLLYTASDPPIVLQRRNGPCPLIAMLNVLFLRNSLQLEADFGRFLRRDGADYATLPFSVVRHVVAEYIRTHSGQTRITLDNTEHDVKALLARLLDGLEVNPLPTGSPSSFRLGATTAAADVAMSLFMVAEVPLTHAWLIDSHAHSEAYAFALDRDFDQLAARMAAVESLSPRGHSSSGDGGGGGGGSDAPLDAEARALLAESDACAAFKRFYTQTNGRQITAYGLRRLHAETKNNSYGVLFFASHFHTITKRKDILYSLITDAALKSSLPRRATWQLLSPLDDAGYVYYFDEAFKPLYSPLYLPTSALHLRALCGGATELERSVFESLCKQVRIDKTGDSLRDFYDASDKVTWLDTHGTMHRLSAAAAHGNAFAPLSTSAATRNDAKFAYEEATFCRVSSYLGPEFTFELESVRGDAATGCAFVRVVYMSATSDLRIVARKVIVDERILHEQWNVDTRDGARGSSSSAAAAAANERPRLFTSSWFTSLLPQTK